MSPAKVRAQKASPMSILKDVYDDKADEAVAVTTYGKRKKQYPEHKADYAEMQEDEKDHKRRLSKIIEGLRKAK